MEEYQEELVNKLDEKGHLPTKLEEELLGCLDLIKETGWTQGRIIYCQRKLDAIREESGFETYAHWLLYYCRVRGL